MSIRPVRTRWRRRRAVPACCSAACPAWKPAEVLVIGSGVVDINAARMAMGMNAHVTILDRSLDRLKYLDELYGHQLTTIYSTRDAIEERLPDTDLVIGAVLIPGAAAPSSSRATS